MENANEPSERKVPRIALVGCGAIAESLYLPAISRHPSVMERLIVADSNKARAQRVASRFNVRAWLADYKEVLSEVDGAIVAVPHNLHYLISMDFLRKGAHVLCEKPLAVSGAEAKEMVAQARESGVTLSVNCSRRLFPSYSKVKDLLSSGIIGRPLSLNHIEGFTYNWPSASGFRFNRESSNGGVLLDTGAHVLDTICWWLESKPKLISCESDSFGGSEGVIRIKFEHNGCFGEIKLNWLSRLKSNYTIVGERGVIEGDVFDYWAVNITSNSGAKKRIKLSAEEKDTYELRSKIVDNFLDVVGKGEEPLIPASEVVPSIEWIEECYGAATRFSMPWLRSLVLPDISKEEKKTVLVVGASGFIGGRVVETLHLSGSADVRAGIRQWSSAARIARFPVEMVPCDIMDEEQIAQAMTGVTHVIHCAKGDRDVIVQGTKNLLSAALRQGIERFVYLSTAEIYGKVSGRIDETFAYQYTGNEYADSKIEAEKLCWMFYEKGLPATVLRPSIVYGPFSRKWTNEIAERLQSGNWGILKNHGEGICNLVFIDDLISGILLAASHESAVGQAFNINGSELITWNQYFQRFAEALGLSKLHEIHPARSKLNSTVMGLVRTSGSYIQDRFRDPIMRTSTRYDVVRKAKEQVKKSISTTPTLGELGFYSRNARYPVSKAQNLLGYHPRFDVDTGLEMTVSWLEHHGFLLQ